jgi:hypothetical protein|tara:strand:- start:267 stop:476 length:210 start_codon:yes stop_codon:yes gene_type:complete
MDIEIQIILNLIPILGAMIGVYVTLTKEVERLRGRIYSLEADRDEVKLLVKECIEGIQELKILLAKKGL